MLIRIQHGDHLKIIPFISNGELVPYKEMGMMHLQKGMDFTAIYDSADGMLKRLGAYQENQVVKYLILSKSFLIWKMLRKSVA